MDTLGAALGASYGRKFSRSMGSLSHGKDTQGMQNGIVPRKATQLRREGQPSALLPPTDAVAPHERIPDCSFCGTKRAAVTIEGLVRRSLCLDHYYTTRAVRMDLAKVRPAGDGSELRRQLPAAQSLFAEAFCELRAEIAEEAARSYASGSATDPLGMVHDSRRSHPSRGRKRRAPPPPRGRSGGEGAEGAETDPLGMIHNAQYLPHTGSKKKRPLPLSKRTSGGVGALSEEEGGFLREASLPQRYVRQQIRQKQLERTVVTGIVDLTVPPSVKTRHISLRDQENPYRRRKPARTSVWNKVLDSGHDKTHPTESKKNRAAMLSEWKSIEMSMKPSVKCSCGSSVVESDGNVTGRNNDTAKGETWGNKDRPDVVIKYRCMRCGKSWNEEE